MRLMTHENKNKMQSITNNFGRKIALDRHRSLHNTQPAQRAHPIDTHTTFLTHTHTISLTHTYTRTHNLSHTHGHMHLHTFCLLSRSPHTFSPPPLPPPRHTHAPPSLTHTHNHAPAQSFRPRTIRSWNCPTPWIFWTPLSLLFRWYFRSRLRKVAWPKNRPVVTNGMKESLRCYHRNMIKCAKQNENRFEHCWNHISTLDSFTHIVRFIQSNARSVLLPFCYSQLIIMSDFVGICRVILQMSQSSHNPLRLNKSNNNTQFESASFAFGVGVGGEGKGF